MSSNMNPEDKLKAMLGGDEGIKDIMAEAISDKLDDDGMLVYVPPMMPLQKLKDEDLDAAAEMDAVNMFRYIYSDLRTKVKEMMEKIFDEMKSSDNDTEIRLNSEFDPCLTEEDIDYVTKAMLDGDD